MAKLSWAGEDGVLLYDQGLGACTLTTQNRVILNEMLPLLPADYDLPVGHDLWYRDELAGRLGLWREELYVQAVWTALKPSGAPAFGGELHFLGEEWAPYVCEHYSRNDIGSLEHIRQAIGAGVLEAFADETLMGFTGFHGEGSIGLLKVLPACRRRGLEEALLRGAMRLALERGQCAPGQMFIDNTLSLALQEEVGMILSKQPLYWLPRRQRVV